MGPPRSAARRSPTCAARKADADHLEAAARGPEARHAVFRRVAEAFLARGFLAEASSLFERALRYAPDDAEAVAGLARALRAAGQDRRALDLLARAAVLAARKNEPAYGVVVDLARGLAEIAGDRPGRDRARPRRPARALRESFEARRLEARWRAELGDLAGASLALGRLRDAIETAGLVGVDRAAELAAMLVEAATIEERDRGDLALAQRSLGIALAPPPARSRHRRRSSAASPPRSRGSRRPSLSSPPTSPKCPTRASSWTRCRSDDWPAFDVEVELPRAGRS